MSGQHWENYDVKRETVHCYPRNVDRCCTWPDVVAGISARFLKFPFVLFCYITNHLMTGPLTEHVKNICVSCHYHLRNIAKIRKYLSENTSEILVHAFISSKLDNCNSLLYGLPKHLLNKLRLVQNTAARIVTLTKRFDHITPIMFQLHWLLLNYRIHFKILLLVFKCLNGLAPTYLSDLLHYHN